jgi:hypothetical protein
VGARVGRIVCLLAVSAALTIGCGASGGGGVAADRDDLSRAVTRAVYARDYQFLYEHATGNLKSLYGSSKEQWTDGVTARLREEDLSEGDVDASRADVQYTNVAGSTLAQVFVDAPAGTRVDFGVFLKRIEDNRWAYCGVGVREAGSEDDYNDLFGPESPSGC